MAMVKRVLLAALVAMVSGAAQAEHAIAPEADLLPVVTQEVCTTADWGYDAVRTDCRTVVRAASKPSPALKGICTIYYGRRTCY
jgi:hypothetical protein